MDYLTLINKYGNELLDFQKPIARRLFQNLLKLNWSYEKIYWGIRLLKGRPIDKYKGLFFYKEFIYEIDRKVEEAHELIDVSFDEKVKAINLLCGYGSDSIPEEYKEQFYALDNKLFNSDIDYSDLQLQEEVDFIYETCYLIPIFSIPLEDIERY